MGAFKRLLVSLNIKPTEVIVLKTGLTCVHYSNGTFKII